MEKVEAAFVKPGDALAFEGGIVRTVARVERLQPLGRVKITVIWLDGTQRCKTFGLSEPVYLR